MKRPFSAYQGDEPYIFVCYAHEDSSSIYPEIQRLHEAGVRMWYDEGIAPGTRWSDELARALSKATLVLFFCTPQSVKSQHCQDEVNFALDEKRPLLVIQDGAVDLSPGLRLRLGAHQSILKHELSVEQFVDKLTAAISRHVVGGPHIPLDKSVASPSTAMSEKSIAVLPFTDMSQQKDQEYFADGMAEEIINLLAKVPELLVSARTSSFFFKGKQTKIPDIARELGVAHVLEGSIRRSGDRLRVTAQLARADNGYHLWSETYDRELQDVFKVQDDIANAVVQALQIKLMGGELTRRKGGTQNLEAYQLYLRAVSARLQNTQLSLDAAGKYLDRAIELDPDYGVAWSELAANVVLMTSDGFLAATEGFERARRLARHALQLSPGLADAHASLAWVLMGLDRDWAAAETEAQRALAVDPTNTNALMFAGNLSRTLGRWGRAEQQLRMALARDPLDPLVILNLGGVYFHAGRFADAERMFGELLERAPGFVGVHYMLGRTLLAQGKPQAALAMVQQEIDEAIRLWLLPAVLLANGLRVEADEALKALIAQWADRAAYCVAMNYAYRDDYDVALQWLERAYKQNEPDLLGIVGEPLFRSMADDPRYKAFLRKMNLPE